MCHLHLQYQPHAGKSMTAGFECLFAIYLLNDNVVFSIALIHDIDDLIRPGI